MQLITLICAEQCAIDSASNRTSIFNLLEELKVPTFPSAMYLMTIFSLWEREPTEADFDASVVITLNGREIFRNPLRVNFQDMLRCRAIMVLQGLVINEPGLLLVEIDGAGAQKTWRVNIEHIQV
jgi:hypothetical protein